jgi:hypothetical protein
MRTVGLVAALMVLTGCQMLKGNKEDAAPLASVNAKPKITQNFCFYDQAPELFEHNCDPSYWLNLWLEAGSTNWSERKTAVKALGATEFDVVTAYIYTLPNDTPYQDRLRAQLSLNEVAGEFTPLAQQVVSTIAGAQNNQLMELESALVVLEKENTLCAQQLKALKSETDTLRKKLEELLQIEATLMDKNRSTQQ